MNTINKVGKWMSFKLDSLAKAFISKSDLLDISLQEQEGNISNMIEAQVQLKTARKSLQDATTENNVRLKRVIANINQYVKNGKDTNAKIEIRAKIDIEHQSEMLAKSVNNMIIKEELMKRKIETLRQIHLIQQGKVTYFKTVSKATKAQLKSVDVNLNDLDMNKIMQEMSDDIKAMDNRMSALDEMEEDGTIKRESATSASDAEIEEELDRVKSVTKTTKTKK